MKPIARFFGKFDGWFVFTVAEKDYNAIADWWLSHDRMHYLTMMTDAVVVRHGLPPLKKSRRYVALPRVSDLVLFEQRFPVAGLSPEILLDEAA